MATGVFLFSDIEGSTRLWANQPSRMRDALARHDVLLGEVVAGEGGTVFNHTGDGLACWFPSTTTAVAAAQRGQQELTREDWHLDQPMRVRMAIHAGDADPRQGGWFGPALNRCARLLGIAHGGQVLVSAAARALLVDGLPPDLELVPLGTHRLRDLALAEDVFQLAGAGLVRVFPPLRSLEAFRGELPSQLTVFVGRDIEVGELAAAVVSRRLVTVVGPGGMGKTRLALQAAAAVVDKFPDGVWFVELAPVADPDAVDHALVATLHLQPRRGLSPRELVLDALVRWQALIVLDNCEHVLEAATMLASALVRGCSGVSVLATSREQLHLPGEQIWPLRALRGPDAIELFADRARAVKPEFVLDDATRPVVEDICHELDDMPLAIELAAARLRSMSAVELAGRLDQRFRLLSGERRVTERRHSALHAVVQWSHELLGEAPQTLFDRLAVFAGGFDLPAVHAVCGEDAGDELDTLDMLEQLVEKSLVQADERAGRTRYSLLETMRQFGMERIGDGDMAILRGRHCRHYAAMAEASWDGRVGSDDLPWRDWLVDELDNLRLAWAWALDTGDNARVVSIPANLVTYASSFPAEVWSWAEQAAVLRDAEHQPFANRLFQHIAWGKNYIGEGGTVAWVRRAESVEMSGRCRPDPGTPLVLGPALVFSGDIEGGLAASERAEKMGEAVGSAYFRTYALYLQVYALLALGRSAIEPAEKALAIALRSGNERLRAYGLVAAAVAMADDDPIRARDLFLEARPLTQRLRLWNLYGSTVAYLPLMQAGHDPTLTGLREALDLYGSLHSSFGVHNVARSWMPAFAELGRYETVALIDGFTTAISIWPGRVDRAIEQARAELGDDAYERGMARARSYDEDEFRRAILANGL